MPKDESLYTSKIIKAGALLNDTKTLLANWDNTKSINSNLEYIRFNNIFGKSSRSRVEDILVIFKQRYLSNPSVINSLKTLLDNNISTQILERILYFYSVRTDRLLHDLVTDKLASLYWQGRYEIVFCDIEDTIAQWVSEGKTSGRWSSYTITRVVRGLLSTLRDFGVLEGAANKRIRPIYLPIEAFSYIAMVLQSDNVSGVRLLNNPEWQLFFLTTDDIENRFVEAHQRRLLEYYAAGSIIRISFPANSLEEYAYVISQRPN